MYIFQHCFICCSSDSTVSEDAGIEPRTFATLAFTAIDALITRLNLIHASLYVNLLTIYVLLFI